MCLVMKKVAREADVIKWVSHVHLWPKTKIVGEAKAFQPNDTEVITEIFIDNNLNKNTPLDVINEEGRIHCNTMLENMLNKYGFKYSITNAYHATKSKVKQWKCYKTQKIKPIVGEKSKGSKEVSDILNHCHSSSYGRHASTQKTSFKILQSDFWWPSLFKDVCNNPIFVRFILIVFMCVLYMIVCD